MRALSRHWYVEYVQAGQGVHVDQQTDSRPLYEQVADHLRAAIEKGELKPGDQVSSEAELSAEHDVSRQTVRLALQQLTQSGLLTSGRGRGRYVRSYMPLQLRMSHLESRTRHEQQGDPSLDAWASDVKEQGREPRQQVDVGIIMSPPKVAERLRVKPDEEFVVVRRRVRYVDDVPCQLADSYFSESLVRGTQLMEPRDVTAPGGILASIGYPQTRFVDEITIRMPTKDEAERLGLQAGTPVAEHVRTGYGEDGTPLRVMVTTVPGDRNVLVYELDAT